MIPIFDLITFVASNLPPNPTSKIFISFLALEKYSIDTAVKSSK